MNKVIKNIQVSFDETPGELYISNCNNIYTNSIIFVPKDIILFSEKISLKEKLTEYNDFIVNTNVEITNIKQSIKNNSNNISNLFDICQNINNDILTINNKILNNTNNINNLQNNISNLEIQVNENSTNIIKNTNVISQNTRNIQSINSELITTNNKINTNTISINTVNSQQTAINNDQNEVITFLYNEIRKLQSQIGVSVLPPASGDDIELPPMIDLPASNGDIVIFHEGEIKMFNNLLNLNNFITKYSLIEGDDYELITNNVFIYNDITNAGNIIAGNNTYISRQNLPIVTYHPGGFTPNVTFSKTPTITIPRVEWGVGFKNFNDENDWRSSPVSVTNNGTAAAEGINMRTNQDYNNYSSAVKFPDDYANGEMRSQLRVTEIKWEYPQTTVNLSNFTTTSTTYYPTPFELNPNGSQTPINFNPPKFNIITLIFLKYIKKIMTTIVVKVYFSEGETRIFTSKDKFNNFVSKHGLKINEDFKLVGDESSSLSSKEQSQSLCISISNNLENAGNIVGSNSITLTEDNFPLMSVPIILPEKTWSMNFKQLRNNSVASGVENYYSLIVNDSLSNTTSTLNTQTGSTMYYVPSQYETNNSSHYLNRVSWSYGGESVNVQFGNQTPTSISNKPKQKIMIMIEFLKDIIKDVNIAS